MSLITLGVWIGAFFVFMTGVWAVLPDAADYPFPNEFVEGIQAIYGYMYALNDILPIYELAVCAFVVIAFESATQIIWPAVMWIIKTVRGLA